MALGDRIVRYGGVIDGEEALLPLLLLPFMQRQGREGGGVEGEGGGVVKGEGRGVEGKGRGEGKGW